MATLHEIVVLVRSLSREAFVADQSTDFLLRRIEKVDDDQQWTFKTQTMPARSLDRLRAMATPGEQIPAALSCYEVFPLVKSAHNPWPNRISLGRARNNDIVILDASISKLHAHFVLGPAGRMTVTDAGSSNGTQVNGRRIERGQVAELGPGDTLVFGGVALRYFSPAALFDFVGELLGRP